MKLLLVSSAGCQCLILFTLTSLDKTAHKILMIFSGIFWRLDMKTAELAIAGPPDTVHTYAENLAPSIHWWCYVDAPESCRKKKRNIPVISFYSSQCSQFHQFYCTYCLPFSVFNFLIPQRILPRRDPPVRFSFILSHTGEKFRSCMLCHMCERGRETLKLMSTRNCTCGAL